MTILETLLQRFGLTRSDLSGAALSGEIPLSNAVVNRFVADQLAGRDVPVSSIQLDALGGDSFAARVVAKARLVPTLRIVARVERQPELPADPVLWLRWSMPGMGALAFLAAPALAFFKALPPGVRADGDRIRIDVTEVLVSRGLAEIVGHVRGLGVHTRPGAFLVRFDVRIAEGAETAGRADADRAEGRSEQP